MKDTLTERKAQAEPKPFGKALMARILAFIGECIITSYMAEGSRWALHAVRVEREVEVVRR